MRPVFWRSTIVLALTVAACDSSRTPATQTAATNEEVKQTAPGPTLPVTREFVLPSGTMVAVRLDRGLSTVRNRAGDRFEATLDAPVMIDGREVLHRGTRFTGHVTTSAPSGRLRGRGVLGITLDAFELSGQRHPITASLDTKTTRAHKKRNIEVIGGGTGVGALIGSLAGGGKGAGIGAAVGAAAGTGVAATTGKKNVEVPAETLFRFSLKRPVRIVE
jgi:hypothetical protein